MTDTIGLVVAMSAEARALVGRGRWEQAGEYPFQRSRLTETAYLITVRSGMGWGNASAASRWLIRQGVDALGVAGVCAGLAPRLVPGDLILADVVTQEEGGRCQCVWVGDAGFAATACGALRQAGFRAYVGTIITVRSPVLTQRDKESLHQRSGAMAAEMESAAAALAAGEASIPFFAFRAVCDAADRSIPAGLFDSLHQGGRIRPLPLVQRVLWKPTLLSDLFQMTRDFGAALTALRRGWNGQLKYRVTSLLAP